MGQKKLLRFEAIGNFANVLQYPNGMPCKWKDFFKNDNPITLELACGKGEYTVGLAALYPDRNFIGVDLKGNRIYAGALEGLKNNLHNAAFLRTHIDKIDGYFYLMSSEIWITFPIHSFEPPGQKKANPSTLSETVSKYLKARWFCASENRFSCFVLLHKTGRRSL
jgi:hypothetical protein